MPHQWLQEHGGREGEEINKKGKRALIPIHGGRMGRGRRKKKGGGKRQGVEVIHNLTLSLLNF